MSEQEARKALQELLDGAGLDGKIEVREAGDTHEVCVETQEGHMFSVRFEK